MYTRDKPAPFLRKLTRNQSLVLEILRAEGRAMTAYQILEALSGKGFKAPPQVYRALDNLIEREEVHRIESLNAFVACNHRDHGDLGGFAICDDCRNIWEFTLPEGAEITAVADSKGFRTHEVMVELHGRCADCDRYGPPAGGEEEADEAGKPPEPEDFVAGFDARAVPGFEARRGRGKGRRK
jgi:Fur family zinc uptake transcriptional regulator